MRYFADYHTHTEYSGDSDAPMEQMIRRSVELGLMELVFTDHVDYDYADPVFEEIDYEDYVENFQKLKKKYYRYIKLLLGVEIGFQPHVANRIDTLCARYPFDFIIYSTHTADQQDFYTGAFFNGKKKEEAYQRYFENVLASLQNPAALDVYGHLDFIVRYGNYESKSLSYYDYPEIIDKILNTLIDNERGIEINTSGYRYGLQQMHPHKDIIQRYKKLGGEIITVGSDAHSPQDLCADFNEAYNLLRESGFKYITAFERRKPRFVKLP